MTRNNLWQVSSSNVNLWQALALYGNSNSQLQDLLIYDNNVKHALASNDRQFWTMAQKYVTSNDNCGKQ